MGGERTVCFWMIDEESRRDMHILTAMRPSGPVSIDCSGAYSTYHAARNSKHDQVSADEQIVSQIETESPCPNGS